MNVALFVSGSGSLIAPFVEFDRENSDFDVVCVVSDRECKALSVAEFYGIETYVFDKMDDDLLNYLSNNMVDMVCLAGFLKIIPGDFIEMFDKPILNTHPSLIPKFCGMGMHGDKVHKAVIKAGEKSSGVSIHLVTREVDAGPIVEQIKCEVLDGDTFEILRGRVQDLEKEWYPKVAYKYYKSHFG